MNRPQQLAVPRAVLVSQQPAPPHLEAAHLQNPTAAHVLQRAVLPPLGPARLHPPRAVHHIQHSALAPPRPAQLQFQNRWPPVVLQEELCVGNILLLPVQYSDVRMQCVRYHDCDKGGIMDDGYGHPVVVLQVKQRPGSQDPGDLVCLCAEITTFQDSNLGVWLEHQKLLKFRVALPIYQPNAPQPRVQFPIQQLCTSIGWLTKQSYVRIQHIWEIPISCLWNWNFNYSTAYGVRLSKESLELLMEKFDLRPEPYEQIEDLPAVAQWRRDTLCGTLPGAPPPPISTPPIPRFGNIHWNDNNFRRANEENHYAVQAPQRWVAPVGPEGFVDATPRNRQLDPTAPVFQPSGGQTEEEIPLGYYSVPTTRAPLF